MYAIRSYYVYRVASGNEWYVVLLSDNRITSYNVCYTKLLRNGDILQPYRIGCAMQRKRLEIAIGMAALEQMEDV